MQLVNHSRGLLSWTFGDRTFLVQDSSWWLLTPSGGTLSRGQPLWIQAIQELDVYLSLTVQDVCVLYDPKEAWLGAKDTNRMFDAVADFLLLKNEITDQQKTLSVSAAVIIKKVTEVRQKGQKRRR